MRRILTDPVSEFARYLRTETVGGMVLLAASAIALVWANSPGGDTYRSLRETSVGPASLHLNLTVAQWAADGLLAVFFFVAGLELKRELVVGELATVRQAVLPVAAALGGMVVPALAALAVGRDTPGMEAAWAIPAATDIAFALAVLALAGAALPATARIFLLGLAVVDDLGAIALIAVLFTDHIDLLALAGAGAAAACYWLLQRRRVRTPLLYVPLALITWVGVHEAGVHATIAGVVLGLLTRVRPDPGEAEAPVVRMEHRLQPWSAGLCVPLFALFAAGVPVDAAALRAVVVEPLPLAVVAGLLVGKVVGIFGACFLTVRLTPAVRPAGLGWRDMLAVAMLGGVGFTVSLLLAELALQPYGAEAVERAKAAVLLASAASALLAAGLLVVRGRAHRRASRSREDPAMTATRRPTVAHVKARDLAQPLPTVSLDEPALDAARIIAEHGLPGIAVLDSDGKPVTVLPASDLLRAVVPGPVLDDPSLTGVLDEPTADLCAAELADKRVRDVVRGERHRVELAAVRPEATVVECAATMARLRSPAVAVLDRRNGDRLLGLITAAHLLDVLLGDQTGQARAK